MESRKINKVSDTAKPILAVKYVTSKPSFWMNKGCGERKTPLSHNECAKIFLSEEDIHQAENRKDIDNLKTVSVRERWINKIFHRYIKNEGYSQVVILGSGYDIRAHKNSAFNQSNKQHSSIYSKVKFWEFDQQEVLDEKERIFKENNLDKNATYLKADYTECDFIQMLIDSGLDTSLPTFFIFEGNLMYLSNIQAKDIFDKLKSSFQKMVIAFDYFPQSLINKIVANAVAGSNESFWKTGIDDLYDFAEFYGLKIIDKGIVGELSKQYEVDNNPSFGANLYSVCALGK